MWPLIYKKKLIVYSVISLSLLRTKKTHTGAVQQGFLRGLEVITLVGLDAVERSNIFVL